MIPSTYYCATRNATYEVQVVDVQPQWACASFAKYQCMIGQWTFDCTHFITVGIGHGMTKEAAFANAVRDMNYPEVGNEEAGMLGE